MSGRSWMVLALLAILVPGPPAPAADESASRGRALWACRRADRDLAAGRLDRAYGRFSEAAAMDPTCAEARSGLGRAAALVGRCEEAVVHLRAAVDLHRLDMARRTADQVDQARLIEERNQALKAVGWEDHMLHPKHRVESMDPAVVLDGSEGAVPAGLFFQMGVCLLRLGRVGEARDAFAAELTSSPSSAAVRINLAVCELGLGNPRLALAALDAAVGLGAVEPDGLRAEIEAQLEQQ